MNFKMIGLALLSVVISVMPKLVGQDSVASLVGKTSPEWQGLLGTDGEVHASSELAESKGILVVFLCNHCPCAKSYEDRFKEFAKSYKDRGITLVAFNADKAETLDMMKQRAKESSFNFVYLKDRDQAVAKGLGAKTTPHVFLLDRDRKVVFSGAFDDDKSGKSVTKNYVADAVEELLTGKEINVKSSRLCGCVISY